MKKKKINWQAVDWQKTNKELAKDLGYTDRHIANKRKELGIANPPYKDFKDWESLDWNLPNTELAKQIGYHPTYIGEKRKELGKPPRRKQTKGKDEQIKRINAFNRGRAKVWDDVDWTKPDREISEQINRTISSVGKKRKELGIAPVRVYDADRWRNMDWSKSNQEIMQETGVSITTVCTNRVKFAPSQHKKPKKIRIDWKKVDWSLTSQEIAKKFGYHLDYVRAKRKEFDKKSKKNESQKLNWHTVDWTKSNKEIAQTLGTSAKYVAEKRRALGKSDDTPPKWWQVCDWKKSNKTLAKETGLSEHTIAKRRVNLGLSHTGAKETRKDKGVSRPQPHLAKPEYQRLGTQTAKQSPKAGKFETNIKSKVWTVKDPNNKTHTFTNLLHFVRQNPHLFDPADVAWRKKKNGVEWCRASSGIGGLASKSNQAHQWKGWKLISVEKQN